MKSIRFIIVAVLLVLIGCSSSNEALIRYYEQKASEDQIKNEQIALAMGEKKFTAPKNQVFKAIITATANKNLTVVNVDANVGFIIAEGPSIIDPTIERQLYEKIFVRERSEFPDISQTYMAGALKIKLTGTLEIGPEQTTIVKVGVSSRNASGVKSADGKMLASYNTMPSEITMETYRVFWEAVDKALFINTNLK